MTEESILVEGGWGEDELFSAVQSFSRQVEEDYRRYPHDLEEER